MERNEKLMKNCRVITYYDVIGFVFVAMVRLLLGNKR